MKKGHYSIFINAPKETVWKTMMEQETYRTWTTPFHEGSYYVGDWNMEGSTVRFLGPSEDGTGDGGMLSRVFKQGIPKVRKRPYNNSSRC